MATSFHLYTYYFFGQVKEAEQRLLHKLFPPNAWMKVADFHVLTSCPKDKLHQWFIGLYGEHIIPAIVHRYTTVLQRPNLIYFDKNKVKHQIISNEAVARVFRRLARPRGKEAMFTRSTRGCGHSGALSLALAACLCPKLNGSARLPGLRLLREAGRRGGQDSVQLMQNDGYILGIYQAYTAIYTF